MAEKLTLRPFRHKDIHALPLRTEDMILLGCEWFLGGIMENARAETAFTALADGEIFGFAGISLTTPGRGEAWGLFPNVQKKKFFVARQVKKGIEDLMARHNLTRVSAAARCDWPTAQRFLEHLGFRKEGLMRKFETDDADSYLYARVL